MNILIDRHLVVLLFGLLSIKLVGTFFAKTFSRLGLSIFLEKMRNRGTGLMVCKKHSGMIWNTETATDLLLLRAGRELGSLITDSNLVL